VETNQINILFDTGQGFSASHNANQMGVDLKLVDKIVLSHGHFDHTGGLKQVLLDIGREIEVIAHPDIWAAKFNRPEGEEARYIGIPFHRQSLGARFNLSREPMRISDNIMTTGAGLVVILGCAHHGVINTLYRAQKLTGVKAIYAVYGGSHLINATEERVWLTIAALKELGVQQLGLGHCTGLAASAIMAMEFGDRFLFNVAGTKVSL
jgi:7,8-dihydropterin-6-yl-methyl-4-(beta-D-ribofuranosyl)aminobenzene 5'-phosphate synthase